MLHREGEKSSCPLGYALKEGPFPGLRIWNNRGNQVNEGLMDDYRMEKPEGAVQTLPREAFTSSLFFCCQGHTWVVFSALQILSAPGLKKTKKTHFYYF